MKDYDQDRILIQLFDFEEYIDYLYDKYGDSSAISKNLLIDKRQFTHMTALAQSAILAHWRRNFFDKGKGKRFLLEELPDVY